MFFQTRQTKFILKYPFNFTGIGPKKCVSDVTLQVFVWKNFLNLNFSRVCPENFF